MSETNTRVCIKCKKELPVGSFEDNWRHKVNICRKCNAENQKGYKMIRRERRKE